MSNPARWPEAKVAFRRMRAAALMVCIAAGMATPANAAERPGEAETQKVLTLGPWPPKWTPDPSNRVSGDRRAAELGRQLFHDRQLSRFGALSCASCHKPALAWGDGRTVASSVARLDRNTPSLFNLRYARWFGWDGGADSLWMQSVRPILDPREMASSPGNVRTHLAVSTPLARAYQAVFGARPSEHDAQLVLVNVAKALAAYQETIVTGRTPFDDYRDALAAGDAARLRRYPEAARRGLSLFVGKGNCVACHAGPLLSNGEFHDIGLPHFTGAKSVDEGRHEGLRKLKASPYTRLGEFSDDKSGASGWMTRHVAAQHRNFGEFKVPSLRNVALTAPYMHNGSKATLTEVVRHYSELDEDRLHVHGEKILRRLDLTDREIADLVAFLESLTEYGAKAPKSPRP